MALIQLAINGSQDKLLTDNPNITFFKTVYKKYSDFFIESVPCNFNTRPNFGTKNVCNISKKYDILKKMYLVVTLPKISKKYKTKWIKNVGYSLIKNIEFVIGNTVIDTQCGDWMYIRQSLMNKNIDRLIGNVEQLNCFTYGKDSYTLYIPLSFWFCNNAFDSLPLCCLGSNDVSVSVEFNNLDQILCGKYDDNIILGKTYIISECVKLSKVERDNIVKSRHKFLIEQIKYDSEKNVQWGDNIINLNFKNLCKQLIWRTSDNLLSYTNNIVKESILFNGNEQVSMRDASYFTQIQIYQNFKYNLKNIHAYSFQLYDGEISGVTKFDMNNVSLKFNINNNKNIKFIIYARCINILTISDDCVSLLV